MDDALLALVMALLVVGVTLAHLKSGKCETISKPKLTPPPAPIGKDASAMGVHGKILHALQSVIEPMRADDPLCIPRPTVEDVPDHDDVEHIIQQICWNASVDPLEFHPGVVVKSLVKRDDIGTETFIITTFLFERSHITSIRVTIKAERRGVNDSLHIRAIAYDPFVPDMSAPHTGPGEISASPGEVDTSAYRI